MRRKLKEKPKPNYEKIRESVIYAKKLAYRELQQKTIKYINAICIGDDGSLRVMGDCDKYINDIHDAEMEFAKASQNLLDYNEDPDKYINKVFCEVNIDE